ncbi:MAG: ATPase, T2SS/T4P/T4SS family [Nitrospiraceae bacterium]|nr:ATPase, T2SS/T4P/T4SS family [Nitrospiraceae bacterium]
MKVVELSPGRVIGVVSDPDGDLPAPPSFSESLVGLEDGRLIILESLKDEKEVLSYRKQFSDYLDATGVKLRATWVPEQIFRSFLSTVREVPSPPLSESEALAAESEPEPESAASSEKMFPETDEIPIPEALSGKVVATPDGQIFAAEDLRGSQEFDVFVAQASMRMDAFGKIGQFRVSFVSDREMRERLSKRQGESPDEDWRTVLADMDLPVLASPTEDQLALPAENSRKDPAEKSSGEKRAAKAPARKPPSPEGSSGNPAVDAGKALPEEKEGVLASREGVPECLSTPSGGTIPDFRAPDNIASMVLLFLDGRFYASREHKTNQHVNYYCRHFVPDLWPKIFGDKPVPKPQYVPYEHLRKIRLENLPEEAATDGFRAEGDEARKIMEIIRDAIARKASDIHLRVERDRTRVLFRIHGWLTPVQTLTHDEGERLARIVYNTMLDSSGRDNMFSDKKPQDGQFRQDYLPRGTFNIREFHAPTGGTGLGTITMVLRLQYGSGTATASAQDIDTLGYDASHLAQLRFLMGLSYGIVLFSGPMGSGKSTSMAAVLSIVLSMNPLEEGRGLHLATLEDPPEYVIPTASQIAVPGAQFSEVLGRIMRFDANLLMIGEIRDESTAEKAVEGAMSGHVVYSTVHANDVLSIPRRLDGLKVRRDLLCDPTIFRGMICQRLVPLLCPDCKLSWDEGEKAGILRPDLTKRLEDVSVDLDAVFFRRTGGCVSCGNQGIVDRTIVAEILIPDQEILDLVAGGRMTEAWRYFSEKLEGRTMMDHAIGKIRAGGVDPRDVEARLGWIHKGSLDSRTIREIIGGLSS